MTAESEKIPLTPEKDASKNRSHFSNTLTTVCSCVGLAVGTGNIWRFPRVLASSSGEGGALVFMLVWLMFLVLWSIPMLFIEYALGRYTQRAVVQSYHYMIGIKFLWSSLFVACVNFLICCYYTVIMGWSLYYFFYLMIHPLPTTYEESSEIFYSYTGVGWPVLTQFASLLLTAGATIRGVKTIEKVNVFLTPSFLVIIICLLVWSLTKENASRGLSFMFTPDWGTLSNPALWVEALSQNAFDTGAGSGIFVAYSSYIPTTEPIAKYAVGIPVANNMISLVCGMTSFSTVFSSLYTQNPNTTNAEVLEILQTSGPGGSGISFIWYPVLLSSAGAVGRVIGVAFYAGLFFAGLSSNIPGIENTCRNLIDLGVKRIVILPIITLLVFLGGLGSALNLNFLISQDFTWGFALLLTGLMLQLLVILYGSSTFREVVINGQSDKDWKIPKIWEWIVKFVAPVEALFVIGWWLVNSILHGDRHGNPWYTLQAETVVTVFLQWLILLFILLLINLCVYKCQPNIIVTRLDEGKFSNEENDRSKVVSPNQVELQEPTKSGSMKSGSHTEQTPSTSAVTSPQEQ